MTTNPKDLVARTRKLCEAARPGRALKDQSAQEYADILTTGKMALQDALPELLTELADALEKAEASSEGSKLQRIVAHCKSTVTVSANDHTTSYQTVKEYMTTDTYGAGLKTENACLSDAQDDIVQRCVEAGVVWEIDAYDRNPVGSYLTVGSTLDEALSEMIVVLELAPDQRGEGESDG